MQKVKAALPGGAEKAMKKSLDSGTSTGRVLELHCFGKLCRDTPVSETTKFSASSAPRQACKVKTKL